MGDYYVVNKTEIRLHLTVDVSMIEPDKFVITFSGRPLSREARWKRVISEYIGIGEKLLIPGITNEIKPYVRMLVTLQIVGQMNNKDRFLIAVKLLQ